MRLSFINPYEFRGQKVHSKIMFLVFSKKLPHHKQKYERGRSWKRTMTGPGERKYNKG